MFIVPMYGNSIYISEPEAEHNLMQEWCMSSWSSQVRFMYGCVDCHELQLTYLYYVHLTKVVTCWEGSSFIHFLICE